MKPETDALSAAGLLVRSGAGAIKGTGDGFVDAPSDENVASVMLPFKHSAAALKLGKAAELAWQYFADASTAEEAAIASLEAEFRGDRLLGVRS